MFMAVKEAYGVLNDEKKRSEYDDQIGFKHADPPPDYHKKWSYKAEMDRIKVAFLCRFYQYSIVALIQMFGRLTSTKFCGTKKKLEN